MYMGGADKSPAAKKTITQTLEGGDSTPGRLRSRRNLKKKITGLKDTSHVQH